MGSSKQAVLTRRNSLIVHFVNTQEGVPIAICKIFLSLLVPGEVEIRELSFINIRYRGGRIFGKFPYPVNQVQ